jgi:AAA domain
MAGPDDSTAALDAVLDKLEGVKRRGQVYDAKCPAHEDHHASLTIGPGDKQPVVYHCHAGCDPDDILAALGLGHEAVSGPRQDRGEWTPAGPAIAVYDYTDEAGKILFQVLRTADKDFRQRVPDPTAKHGYRWALGDTRRVLYRLPRILAAVKAGKAIWLVEGEKDVHALEARGRVATCNPMGAGKWRPEYTECLRDAQVQIVADADKPGRAHARQVAAALEGVAARVRVVEPAEGKDTSDHLAAGHGLGDFLVTSAEEAKPELALDIHALLAMEFPAVDWVIRGLLERGDTLIWTGREGLGKSMVLRQLGVAAGAGVHPFDTIERFAPRRVLVIDCENSMRRNHRIYRSPVGVAAVLGNPLPAGGMRIHHMPRGLNLVDPEEAAWLAEQVRAHEPDLLLVGPLYKLHMSDANEEVAARLIVAALSAAQEEAGCAMVVEAHTTHSDAELRPIGSSLFRRWPDFGMGIREKRPGPGQSRNKRLVEVRDWRGARDERTWPRFLRWGNPARGEFPWVGFTPSNGSNGHVAGLEADADVPLEDLVTDAEERAAASLKPGMLFDPDTDRPEATWPEDPPPERMQWR